MKRILFTLFVVFSAVCGASAQKTGYVNTEIILSSLQEYKDTVAILESRTKVLQTQIEDAFKSVEYLYNSYQETKYNLSQEKRTQVENEIIARERAAKAKQQEYFGENGQMTKATEQALKPIREKVQNAINEVAKAEGYSVVIDLSVMRGVVYNDNKCNISEKVVNRLKSNK